MFTLISSKTDLLKFINCDGEFSKGDDNKIEFNLSSSNSECIFSKNSIIKNMARVQTICRLFQICIIREYVYITSNGKKKILSLSFFHVCI